MINFHIHELRQQFPQHRQSVRLVDIAGTGGSGQRAGFYRQQLFHHRPLHYGGDEPGIAQINRVHFPGGELVNNHPGNGQGILHHRPVAQIGKDRQQILAVAGHKIPPLAPQGNAPHRSRLLQDELGRLPIDGRVHSAGQAPVGSDDQQPDPMNRPHRQQGMQSPFLLRLRRQMGDDFLNLLGVGPALHRGILRPPHFRGGNQRHGIGHLAGVFHAADPPPDVPYTWHSCFSRLSFGVSPATVIPA